MSHPFGDLIAHYIHRKHGLSQSKLAAGILQSPSIITEMCQGKRLSGPQARERVISIIGWLQQQSALETLDEANALLNTASMSPLHERDATEVTLIHRLRAPLGQNQIQLKPQSHNSQLVGNPERVRNLPRHNLPSQLTPFIGRAAQIAQLVQQLQTHRLLTLTGAGGVGKTRLALAVAAQRLDEFADGIWFVDLAPLTDPGFVPQRILDLLRVPTQPDRSPPAALTAYLSAKHLLLILDNCEHLIDACAELVEAILRSCPQVSLLATSREALNIGAELAWRVPSLTRPSANQRWNPASAPAQSPPAPENWLRFEAVALFVERTRTHQPNFALTAANATAVAHICSRLDGIPLALEMAAARVNVFTVEELATRLNGVFDTRFHLLTRGARTAPQRHQTLRATLEWSYALLTPAEQCLLARLSIFSGGWTAAAAEAVLNAECGSQRTPQRAESIPFNSTLDLLVQLVNKSLVIADQQAGQTRYRLLETVRQFAAEQGATDEQEHRQAQTQHSRYYLTRLGEQEMRLQGQQQRTGLDTIRADFENIGIAWRWAVQQREFTILAPAVHALFLFCEVRGHYREGVTLFANAAAELTAAIAADAAPQPTLQPLCGQMLLRLGACEVMLSDYQNGEQHLQDGLPHVTMDWERAFALAYLGIVDGDRGELTLARTRVRASLAISQQSNDSAGAAHALHWLSVGESDSTEAHHLLGESLALWRKVGRPDRIADVLNDLGWHTSCLGDYPQANAYWREGLELCEQLELLNGKAWVLDCMGFTAWCQGEMAFADQYIQEALTIYSDLGRQSAIGMCKAELALVLVSARQVGRAVVLAQEAVTITREVNSQMMLTLSLNYLGAALIAAGDSVAARHTLLEAIQRAWSHQYFYNLMTAFYYFAELLVLESNAADLPIRADHRRFALELLSCVRTQPATWQIFKDKAAQLQAEIEDALPAELRATAIAQGQSRTLGEMVSTLLADAG